MAAAKKINEIRSKSDYIEFHHKSISVFMVEQALPKNKVTSQFRPALGEIARRTQVYS